jgi:hypothetical protein
MVANFRWLSIGLVRDSGDFLGVFDLWQEARPDDKIARIRDEGFAPYYARTDFKRDFLKFVERIYLPRMAQNKAAIQTLVLHERTLLKLTARRRTASSQDAGSPRQTDRIRRNGGQTKKVLNLEWDTVPAPPRGVAVISTPVDYDGLMQRLGAYDCPDIRDLPESPTRVAYRRTRDGHIEISQLSPLSVALLGLVDGRRNIRDLARVSDWQKSLPEGLSPEKAAFFGLKLLYEQSLLRTGRGASAH